MKHRTRSDEAASKKSLTTAGRVYFSKNTERTVFFILTVAMLVFGLLYKANLI